MVSSTDDAHLRTATSDNEILVSGSKKFTWMQYFTRCCITSKAIESASMEFPLSPNQIIHVLPPQYLKKEETDREYIALRRVGDKCLLIPPQLQEDRGKKTLVLDLDETLVHCSFERIPGAECLLPMIVEDCRHMVYVCVRPGAVEFLQKMGAIYEIIIYTASMEPYARSVVDYIDTGHVVRHLLCRNACFAPRQKMSSMCGVQSAKVIKDLSALGRPLESVVLVDNSAFTAALQPRNAIIVSSFIGGVMPDDELYRLMPFLEALKTVEDVRNHANSYQAFRKRSRALELKQQRKLQLIPKGSALHKALQLWQKGDNQGPDTPSSYQHS